MAVGVRSWSGVGEGAAVVALPGSAQPASRQTDRSRTKSATGLNEGEVTA